MQPGTLVKLGGKRKLLMYYTVDVNGGPYDITPNMIGMFIRYEDRPRRFPNATPATFLFEDKLVSAYLEVFEPLEEG